MILAFSYPFFWALSTKFQFFEKYLTKYRWNVVLRTAMMTFFQVFLAIGVQFKYVSESTIARR